MRLSTPSSIASSPPDPTSARSDRFAPHLTRSHLAFDRPELDALRFFAFALVFCDHAPIPHLWFRPLHEIGSFGVAIFFCLSAYLITTLLLRERDHTGTVRLGAFAMRRILRIWPLYIAVTLAGYLAGLHWRAANIGHAFVLALLLMYGNIYIATHGYLTGLLAPLWSISVEEQFYVAVPFIVRLGGRRAVAFISIVALVAAYLALLLLGLHCAIPILQVWMNSFVQFQFFAAGGAIALFTFYRPLRLGLLSRGMLALAGLALLYVAAMVCLLHSTQPIAPARLIAGYLCELVGVAAIFLAVLNLPLPTPRGLRYLGRISYGLYLFHYPLLWFLFESNGRLSPPIAHRHPLITALIALLLTIALASLSYRFFERPILEWKRRFETEKTRI